MMRVHWFSPLLPDATDIGHFTGRVLRELTKISKITVWTQTDEPLRRALPDVDIRKFDPESPDYSALNRGVIVYNLGNNGPFHTGIYRMSQRLPGVVILHEADLQGFFLYSWLKKDHGAPYIDYMRDTYGPLAEVFAKARLRGIRLEDLAHKYPIVRPALTNALGVVSHTRQVTRRAQEAKLPVLDLNLPFAAGDLPQKQPREGPIRLIQFGYLNPHRKLDEILQALHDHPLHRGFRFNIFGRLWNESHVTERIKVLGLEEIVQLKGFVDEEELDQAIAGADMVFNLRFPTIGEASGTQLRIWKNGAPSAVTDDGWFGDLPEDTVFKIKQGNEARSLAQLLDQLDSDRHHFDHTGQRGYERLQSAHNPVNYAAKLKDFLQGFDN